MRRRKVTICVCASRNIIDRDKISETAARLERDRYEVCLEADLCGKVRDAAPEAVSAASGVVLACYPRAVNALFDTLGVKPAGVFDIRNGTAESVLCEMGLALHSPEEEDPLAARAKELADAIAAMPSEKGADPWFPVIDKERCGECGKCHDFCLFGVYAGEDGRIGVRAPKNCKNDCPACARLCPSGAIIFPKYGKSPINGGLENEERAIALDTGAIYNEALRERLRQRSAGVPLLKRDLR